MSKKKCMCAWGGVLTASLLSFSMLCTVIPETAYAAVSAEESIEESVVIDEDTENGFTEEEDMVIGEDTEKKSEETGKSAKKEKNEEAIDRTGRTYWEDIDFSNAVDITEDTVQIVNIETAGDYKVFRFVPTETKEYTFFSEGSYDTYGMIGTDEPCDENDDRDEDENFSITTELTAGETYYCVAQMLSSSQTGSFLCMISSTASRFTLSEDNIKRFEITEYYNSTEYYRFEDSVDDVPLGGYDYRITCMDDQIIEGYLSLYRQILYGANISVRFKNEIEDGIADTTGDTNALIYSLAGVEAEEIPITYIDSPIESMQVLANPWTELLRENEYDVFDNYEGLRVQINYTNGDTKIAVGDYDEWYIEEEDIWIYPGCRWKNYDEDGYLAIGQNAIIFTYLGAELEVPVTVVNIGVQSISIVRNPEKMVYTPFDNTVDLFGLVLRIAYTDGTSEQVSVTDHSRSVKIGKYNLSLTGYFKYDNNDNKAGVYLNYSSQVAEYKPTFQTYASLLNTATAILPGRAVSVSLNENAKYRIFRFIPLDTKEYEIYSTGDFDTYVYLLDANGNQLAVNDDDDDSGNFKLSYRLEAGKTYYYMVRMYSIGKVGTFTCILGGASSYTITYNLNGGTNHASNPAAYYSETVTLQNPSRAKYAFVGWYTESSFKNKITQISGTAKRNYVLYAKWQKVKAPAKAVLSSAANSKAKKISVKYKKVKNADGYEIAYATNKKFKKSSSVTSKKTKATIGKLKKGKTYYVRVCAYKLDSTGQKIRGKWSSAKKVTVKK